MGTKYNSEGYRDPTAHLGAGADPTDRKNGISKRENGTVCKRVFSLHDSSRKKDIPVNQEICREERH